MRLRRMIWLAAGAFFGALSPLAGQEARGTLLGRVSDQTGAVIAGAKLDATNTDTGVHYTSTTNESGVQLLTINEDLVFLPHENVKTLREKRQGWVSELKQMIEFMESVTIISSAMVEWQKKLFGF